MMIKKERKNWILFLVVASLERKCYVPFGFYLFEFFPTFLFGWGEYLGIC